MNKKQFFVFLLLTTLTQSVFTKENVDLNSTLIYNASHNNPEWVVKNLTEGANINYQQSNGFTALIGAVEQDDLSMVRLLLKRKANPNKKDKYGQTALQFATGKGSLEIVKILVNNGAKINQENNAGITPLIIAAARGYKDIVQFLLDKKANVNHRGKLLGRTALMDAAKSGNLEIFKLLLARGAKINLTDIHGKNALQMATPEIKEFFKTYKPASAR